MHLESEEMHAGGPRLQKISSRWHRRPCCPALPAECYVTDNEQCTAVQSVQYTAVLVTASLLCNDNREKSILHIH